MPVEANGGALRSRGALKVGESEATLELAARQAAVELRLTSIEKPPPSGSCESRMTASQAARTRASAGPAPSSASTIICQTVPRYSSA